MNTFKQLFTRRQLYGDLSEEIQGHLAEKIDELVAGGISRKDATAEARRIFGNVTLTEETGRAVWRLTVLEDFFKDIRYGLRNLFKSPGFSAVAILTLALGIGANTAIFSLVYALVLKPLPYAASDRLFDVSQQQVRDASVRTGWSYANFADVREQNRMFSEMAGSQHHQLTLTGRGDPDVLDTSVVTAEFFSVFGQKPLAGRLFSSADGKVGSQPVVVLSEGLWRSKFKADPNIVGSSLNLDQRTFTVVGIVPASFRYPLLSQSEQIWIPLVHDPLFGSWMMRRGGHWLQVTGLLKPGVSSTQAQAELDALCARLSKEFPAHNGGWGAHMGPLQQMLVGNVKTALLVLLGAVGLVLLIACANIANLLLTRGSARAKEFALRASLGAGRARIIRQLLSEAAVLGALGGVAGIALAWWGVQALSHFLPESLPRVNTVRVDYFVLGFALLLSALASFVFGLAPAFFMANSDLQANIREGGRAGETGKSRGLRNLLAIGEVAIAVVLLVAAGLLLRSFSKLIGVAPGFDAQHVVKAEVALPRVQYATPQQWLAFSQELLAGIQAEPGMRESAIVIPTPLADGFINLGFDIIGSPPLSAGEPRTANYVAATPDYFAVMGIPLLAGRLPALSDAMSTPRVAVISKAMVGRYFPHQNPIGKQLSFGFPPDGGAAREIVGVVGDVRDVAVGNSPGPMMYVPYAQAPFPGVVLVVKSSLTTPNVAAAVRRNVQKIDKELPVTDVLRMADAVNASAAQPRFRTFLISLFAAMALALAATGIFGVISYSVSCRTREIGVRLALGASRGAIQWMVLRETLVLTLVGLTIGIPCALAAARLLRHMLFDISDHDPLTLAAVAVILVVVASLAAYLAVRRATRVDPMTALRCE